MGYFVTGATGFIGRHLVSNLPKRKGSVHMLVRKSFPEMLEAIGKRMGCDMTRVIAVNGDMTAAKCPTLAPEEAADLLVKAIIEKPSRAGSRPGCGSSRRCLMRWCRKLAKW